MITLSQAEQADLLEVASALADAARSTTLPHFRTHDLTAESKAAAHFDPVTQADRAAETAMREILARRRPQDAIVGEEFGGTEGTSGLTWVLDPIDGTRAYLSGTPTWGVLIGLRNREGALAGVIDQPYIGERFIGGFGTSMLEGPHGRQLLRTRPSRALDEAILFTTFPEVGTEVEARAFHQLSRHVKLTRYGMDCYAYGMLALGQIDLVVEAGLHSYDIVGPLAVIEAAGGVVTDWRGGPALEGGRVVAAANRTIHAAAIEILSATPDD